MSQPAVKGGWVTALSRAGRCCVVVALGAVWFAFEGQAESLYDPGHYQALMADRRARQVGDVLTVQVVETSSAVTSADTGTRRGNNLSAQWGGRGGAAGVKGLSTQGDFNGGGQTQRSNRLLATLTVTVQDIAPNGELMVTGEQVLTVNDEPQKVTVTGRVRPRDITDGNMVLSTRLADARISYVGDGDIADRNRKPWWRQFLDLMGL